MFDHFMPKTPVQMAACFWGFACFLPVGMTYFAACALMIALCVHGARLKGEYQIRWQGVRQHLVFWPLCFFVAWTLFILCIQPRFAETPSNLFHALRIVLTLVIILMLSAKELQAALVGWVTGAALALIVIYANVVVALPHITGVRDLLSMNGNKSIGISVLLAIFASCSLIYALKSHAHPLRRLSAIGLLLVVPVLIWFLPSRTSLILVMLTLFAGLTHRFWKKPIWLISTTTVLFVLGFGLAQTPQVQQRFSQGIVQLQESPKAENVSNAQLHNTSWGMRYLLYTHTLNMIAEKPLLGWGIGSWNHQWRERTPTYVHAANMPHNDFLWVGAQAGIPAVLALLAMMLSLLMNVVRLRSLAATCSIVATSGLFFAMSFNSALRDAQIGMSVLFLVGVMNAWAIAIDKSGSS
jgi:O-antigen ligase